MSFLPKVSQKAPYITEETAGTRRAWCTCGLSQSQPFCDGNHREGTGMKSLGVVCDQTGKYAWCGCKQTKTPPFCDGSHASLSKNE